MSHMGHKSKLCSDWDHNVDVMAVSMAVYSPIMSEWTFLRFHILETRLDTNYISYIQAS